MMLNHHVKFQVDRIRNVEVVRGTDILCDRQTERQKERKKDRKKDRKTDGPNAICTPNQRFSGCIKNIKGKLE